MLAALKGLALSKRLQDILFIDMFPQETSNIREENFEKGLQKIGAGNGPKVESMEEIWDDKIMFL
jgi:hypothetical protein